MLITKSQLLDSPETEESQTLIIEPQPGPQTQFLECEADVCIFGGSAGGSKSYSVLLDCLRGYDLQKYRALILRRQLKDLTDDGGIIDDAREVFPATGAKEHGTTHTFRWPSGASVLFGHMENAAKDHYRYKSKAYAVIYFEELTEFEEHQFWYMPTRNRSVCGMRPYIRATTNPAPGWVADLLILGGYVDPVTGYAIEEMSGVIRYLIRYKDKNYFFDSIEQAKEQYPDEEPLSFTFIRSKLEDNKKLLDKDPTYIKRVKSAPLVERMRLYDANWIVVPKAGLVFKDEWFRVSHRMPPESSWHKIVRFYDLAATEQVLENGKPKNDPDFTAGVLMLQLKNNLIYILDLVHFRGTPLAVEERIKSVISQDHQEYDRVFTVIECDVGQAGKSQIDYLSRQLSGYRIQGQSTDRKSKLKRAEPLSVQFEQGNVFLMNSTWNNNLQNELVQFPTKGVHDDIVDACSGAFNYLTSKRSGFVKPQKR